MSTTVVSESTVPALSLKHKIYISIEKPLKTPTTSLDPHSILRRHDTQSTIDEPDSPFNANGRTGFETVDVATAEPAYYHRRPISSTNRHLRHMQRTSRAERLRDTTDDIASTNFAIVPVRPPLRPTFSFDSGLSYYSSASPDLESKSLAVAADEEAKHAGGQQAHSIRLYASIAILFVLNFTCGFEAFSFTTILPVSPVYKASNSTANLCADSWSWIWQRCRQSVLDREQLPAVCRSHSAPRYASLFIYRQQAHCLARSFSVGYGCSGRRHVHLARSLGRWTFCQRRGRWCCQRTLTVDVPTGYRRPSYTIS
jgi:hypothetical protein